MGGSTKQNKFGEGLKIAALVLLRGYDTDIIRLNKNLPESARVWEAKTMTILNNESKWSFSLRPDSNIEYEICLHWIKEPRVRDPDETQPQVTVKIGNVSLEEWQSVYEERLLRLSPLY